MPIGYTYAYIQKGLRPGFVTTLLHVSPLYAKEALPRLGGSVITYPMSFYLNKPSYDIRLSGLLTLALCH